MDSSNDHDLRQQQHHPAAMGTFEARPGVGSGNGNGRVKQESSNGEMVWESSTGGSVGVDPLQLPKREEFDPNPQMEPVKLEDSNVQHHDIKLEHATAKLEVKPEDAAAISAPDAVKPEENPDNNDDANDELIVPQRIQAYAKLEFPFFNFYIQKLSVTIGRRPPTSRGASVKPEPETLDDVEPLSLDGKVEGDDNAVIVQKVEEDSSVKLEDSAQAQQQPEAGPSTANGHAVSKGEFKLEEDIKDPSESVPVVKPEDRPPPPESSTMERFAGNKVHVDVDLGPIKAVSRDHARLFFDSETHPITGNSYGWSLEVRGRNGLVLAGKWRAKGEVVRLANRSRIQIAERVFHFVLPNGVPYYSAPPSPSAEDEYYGAMGVPQYDYPPTPERSASPVIYGSDSDELRSDDDHDNPEERRWLAGGGPRGIVYDNGDVGAGEGEYTGRHDSVDDAEGSAEGKLKRKRGRPPKIKTAEQLEAEELERQRRNDPSIPRRPRGRPPKHNGNNKETSEAPSNEGSTPLGVQAALPPLPPQPQQQQPYSVYREGSIPLNEIPESKLTKKQKAELKRIEREQVKEEKARLKEMEKAEKEAAKLAKKEQKLKEDAEKKKKDGEKKVAAVKPKAATPALPPLPPTTTTLQPQMAQTQLALPAKGLPKDHPPTPIPAPQPTAAAAIPSKPASPALQQNLVPPPPVKKPNPAKPPAAPKAATPAPPPQHHFTATNQFQYKPDKPPYSYAALIAQAIYSTASKQASLHHVHAWIPDHYPYFKEHGALLQNAIKQNLAVNRAFVNIPLSTGVALWALEPEQAKLFDGNTFLPSPTEMKISVPAAARHISPTLPSTSAALHGHSPSMSPAPPLQPAVQSTASPAPSGTSKMPIIISALPSTYTKPSSSSSSDPSSMLDPNGFPPIAVHETKMYLSPSIFSTLTPQQLANLQTLETKQALGILQAFVVNYFKVELKKRKKAEKAAAAAAGANGEGNANGMKRQADQSLEGAAKAQKVS